MVLCGNLDPAGIFCQLSADEVKACATGLLTVTARHRNFVLSSGCDLPPNTPLDNLEAFLRRQNLRKPLDSRHHALGQTGGNRRTLAVTVGADFIGESLRNGCAAHQHLHLVANAGLLESFNGLFHGGHRGG